MMGLVFLAMQITIIFTCVGVVQSSLSSYTTLQDLPTSSGSLEYSSLSNADSGLSLPRRNVSSSLQKRYYSIVDEDTLKAKGTLESTHHGPWPRDQCGRNRIRYCFDSEESSQALVDIVTHAIVMWMPAFWYSSLAIEPDWACVDEIEGTDYACVCGQQPDGQMTSGDSLVISANRNGESDPEKWDTETETYVGYDRTSDEPGRHSLKFGRANKKDELMEMRRFILIQIMTHELGR